MVNSINVNGLQVRCRNCILYIKGIIIHRDQQHIIVTEIKRINIYIFVLINWRILNSADCGIIQTVCFYVYCRLIYRNTIKSVNGNFKSSKELAVLSAFNLYCRTACSQRFNYKCVVFFIISKIYYFIRTLYSCVHKLLSDFVAVVLCAGMVYKSDFCRIVCDYKIFISLFLI